MSHQRLLIKLKHYGVRGTTLQWIRSSLSDRTQKVLVEGKSSSAPVTSSVPQGTVLGPYCSSPTSMTYHPKSTPRLISLQMIVCCIAHQDGQGCRVSTRCPQQATGLGKRLADAPQPRQMRTDQNYQQA